MTQLQWKLLTLGGAVSPPPPRSSQPQPARRQTPTLGFKDKAGASWWSADIAGDQQPPAIVLRGELGFSGVQIISDASLCCWEDPSSWKWGWCLNTSITSANIPPKPSPLDQELWLICADSRCSTRQWCSSDCSFQGLLRAIIQCFKIN